MYLKFIQLTSTAAVQDFSAIEALVDAATLGKCTHAEIQVDTQNVRYTMSLGAGLLDPPTTTRGMQFLTTEGPKTFLMEDLRRIRFTNGAGGAGLLNIHLFAGRDI